MVESCRVTFSAVPGSGSIWPRSAHGLGSAVRSPPFHVKRWAVTGWAECMCSARSDAAGPSADSACLPISCILIRPADPGARLRGCLESVQPGLSPPVRSTPFHVKRSLETGLPAGVVGVSSPGRFHPSGSRGHRCRVPGTSLVRQKDARSFVPRPAAHSAQPAARSPQPTAHGFTRTLVPECDRAEFLWLATSDLAGVASDARGCSRSAGLPGSLFRGSNRA